METNKFQLKGDEGLNIYYKWITTETKNKNYTYDILANMDEYGTYDVKQLKHRKDDYTITSTSYVEIKTRNNTSYQFEDCVIDSYKIFNLQKLSATTGVKVFLCAIYTDNKLAIWEIDPNKQYPIINKEVPWHTVRPEDGKRIKEMVPLPLNEAKKYNYQ